MMAPACLATVTNMMETMSFVWNLGCTPGLGRCGSFRCCALELQLRAERGKDESQRGTKERETDRQTEMKMYVQKKGGLEESVGITQKPFPLPA